MEITKTQSAITFPRVDINICLGYHLQFRHKTFFSEIMTINETFLRQ